MSNNLEYIKKCINDNNIDKLRKFIPELKENKALYTTEDGGNYRKSVNLLKGSICDGKLDIVKFFIEDVKLEWCDKSCIDDAANYGHLDVLKYLVDNSTFDNIQKYKSACIGAACNNHIHILEYLHNKGMKMEPYLIKAAYEFGSLDSIIYLNKELGVEWPKTSRCIIRSELMDESKVVDKGEEFANKFTDIVDKYIDEYKLSKFKTRIGLFSVGACIGAVLYKVIR
jgi:hypothetical protein